MTTWPEPGKRWCSRCRTHSDDINKDSPYCRPCMREYLREKRHGKPEDLHRCQVCGVWRQRLERLYLWDDQEGWVCRPCKDLAASIEALSVTDAGGSPVAFVGWCAEIADQLAAHDVEYELWLETWLEPDVVERAGWKRYYARRTRATQQGGEEVPPMPCHPRRHVGCEMARARYGGLARLVLANHEERMRV